jgi:hypothetical protein
MIAHLASPLPLSAYLPQQDGGGVAGEIFRSDITGHGTVGDLPGFIGGAGKYSTSKLNQLIAVYNSNFAGFIQDRVFCGTLAFLLRSTKKTLTRCWCFAPRAQSFYLS